MYIYILFFFLVIFSILLFKANCRQNSGVLETHIIPFVIDFATGRLEFIHVPHCQ